MANCKLLTIRDATRDERIQALGLSYGLMRHAVHTGQLKAVTISKMPLIPEMELDRFVERVSNPSAKLQPTAA